MTLLSWLKIQPLYVKIKQVTVVFQHEKGVSFVDYRLRGHNLTGFDQLRAAYI